MSFATIGGIITSAASALGIGGGAAGGAAGAALGAGGGNALGAGLLSGAAEAAPSLGAAGASPAMWGEAATGSMGGSFGPMVGLGRSSVVPGAPGGPVAAAAPTTAAAPDGGLWGTIKDAAPSKDFMWAMGAKKLEGNQTPATPPPMDLASRRGAVPGAGAPPASGVTIPGIRPGVPYDPSVWLFGPPGGGR